jgi:hypothetical protein
VPLILILIGALIAAVTVGSRRHALWILVAALVIVLLFAALAGFAGWSG